MSPAGRHFSQGTDFAEAFPNDGEGPVRAITLQPFAIDRYPVTNELFEQFIHESGYQTEAERFGWSLFSGHCSPKLSSASWLLIRSRRPRGGAPSPAHTGRHLRARGRTWRSRKNHPVVHVSWHDAQAYCRWSGQRLPSKAEWEYAARGGLVQKIYPWGDKLRPRGEHRCNIWQGDFPKVNTAEHGFSGTCPVDAFPANGYGIYSLSGNTWDWCADWFDPKFHIDGPRVNPQGPPEGTAKVMKGGSFLCHKAILQSLPRGRS